MMVQLVQCMLHHLRGLDSKLVDHVSVRVMRLFVWHPHQKGVAMALLKLAQPKHASFHVGSGHEYGKPQFGDAQTREDVPILFIATGAYLSTTDPALGHSMPADADSACSSLCSKSKKMPDRMGLKGSPAAPQLEMCTSPPCILMWARNLINILK